MNRKSFNRIFFEDKEVYEQLDDESKEEFFFMFNRCLARLAPTNCDALNSKSIDPSLAMDVWSLFFKSKTKEPVGFEPEWWKYKKSKSLLDGFNSMEKQMLSKYYDDQIDQVVEDIEKEKEMGKIIKKKI